MSSRPARCQGCQLDPLAAGFAPAVGPVQAPLLLVGEALGRVEAQTGLPFQGDAGGMLSRLLNLLGWQRDSLRIHNVVSCEPPNDWFDERAPWYHAGMACPYLDDTLREPHQVVVTLGGTALKRVLGLVGTKKIRVQDFHGTIQRDPRDRFWVVPSFHPSFLQRGATNLIGTVLWDLQRAQTVAQLGHTPDPGSLIIDPPLPWFQRWVDQAIAARQQDQRAYPISSDVETPDKAGGQDEGELGVDDQSFQILRVNVSINPDEGVTVPFAGPFIGELARLHQSPGPIWQWNKEYDFIRLLQAGVFTDEGAARQVIDLMWYWHLLQSDLPRGLGFVAPFYSDWGPWKHLSAKDPARYAAIDALQTHRCGFGLHRDLKAEGLLETAQRHTHALHWMALRPAQLVGVGIDRPALLAFKADLAQKATGLLADIQGMVADSVCPMTPKDGLTRPPAANVLHVKASACTRTGKVRSGKPQAEEKLQLYASSRVVERTIEREVWCCRSCGEVEVGRKHRCHPAPVVNAELVLHAGDLVADLTLVKAPVTRWYWQEPFNPDSPPQVLAAIKAKGHSPGRAKKTRKDTTNRETLEKLERTTTDPFYRTLLDYRAVMKVKGTYVEGTERRLDADDRVHPQSTQKPSMMRLSYINPNITNVVADKGGKATLAAGFRKCVVSGPGCRLLEVDFSGIEALKVGERARDPEYIRLAQLGVHAGLATYVLGKPFDRAKLWTDPEALAAEFKAIKKSADPHVSATYDRSKRFVHGRAYGLTEHGMVLQFPELFKTLAIAQKYARIFTELAPKVAAWQKATQDRAARQHYLGGRGDHPYGYKHWFWSVYTYRRISAGQYWKLLAADKDAPVLELHGQYFRVAPGEDSKRALAFYGQSIGAGDLKVAMLDLFDPESPSYIGEAYFGRTPLRAPIHDSLLLEVPDRVWDRTVETVLRVMQQPMTTQPLPAEWQLGPFMQNRVAAKVGHNWEAVEDLPVPGYESLRGEVGLWQPGDDEEQDDGRDFQRRIA